MVRRLGACVLGCLAVALIAPPVLLAQDPVYDASGSPYGRGFFAPLPFESIDTVTGNVVLSFTDLAVPYDGLLSLAVVRTYNSRDGVWRMGISGAPLRFVFNLPNGSLDDIDFVSADGTKHNAQGASATTLTQGFWRFTKATRKLEMPNGLVLTYGHLVTGVGWCLTEIRDPFNNTTALTWTAGTDQLTRISQYVTGYGARNIDISGWTNDRANSIQLGSSTWQYTWSTALPGSPQLTTFVPPGGARWSFTYGSDPQGATKILSLTTLNGGTVSYTWAVQTFPATPSQRVALASRVTGGRAPAGTWTFAWLDAGRTLEVQGPANVVTYATQLINGIPVPTQWSIRPVGQAVMESETATYTSIASPAGGQMPVVATVTRVRGGQNYATTYSYGSANWSDYGQPNQIVETGSLTRTTILTYRHTFTPYILGKVATRSSTVGTETINQSFDYDNSSGFLTAATNSSVTTSFVANAQGNVASVSKPGGRTTQFSYTTGVVSQVTSPQGIVVYRNIDGLTGAVSSETVNNSGVTTVYAYDAAGRVTSVTTTPSGRQGVTTAYNNQNYAWVSTTTSRGAVSVTTDIDGWGRATHAQDSAGSQRRTVYDAAGRVTYQSRSYGSGVADVGDTFTYDALGRPLVATRPDGSTVSYSYVGATTAATESLGGGGTRTTTQYFDAFGSPSDARMTRLVDAIGGDWRYTYNIRGQLTQASRVNDASVPTRTWVYDAKGLMTSMSQPESGTSQASYDAVGNLIYGEDARGSALSGAYYYYDLDDRLFSVDAPGSIGDVSVTYNSAGLLATVANGQVQTTLGYDAFGRLASKTDVVRGQSFQQTVIYDAFDNPVEATYPLSGRKVLYEYDGQQRLSAVRTQVAGGPVSNLATGFVYRGDGSLQSYTFGNGHVASTTRDSRQRPLNWKSGPLDITYAYDHVGNVTSIADSRGAAYLSTFTYDLLDRIQQSTVPGYGTTAFTYTGGGDRLTQGTVTFNYDAATRRLASLSGGASGAFTYDVVGSLLTDPSGASYTYDSLNQLATATVNSKTTGYLYGADGMRAAKIESGGLEHLYVYGAGGLIAEYQRYGSELLLTREYVYLGSQLLASFTPEAVSLPPMAVTLLTPTDGQTMVNGGTLTLTASVAIANPQAVTLARVEYYVRGVLIGSATTAPFSKTWTNTPLPPGTFIFHARAVSTAGQAVASLPVTVTVP